MPSVVIALGEPFVRIGVQETLRGADDFEVVGVVDDGDGVLPALTEHRPDALVLDYVFHRARENLMPAVVSQHPGCRVLMMVNHTDEDCTLRRLLQGPPDQWPGRDVLRNIRECCLLALRGSARGCLPKASPPERLLDALRSIVAGEVWAGPGISSYLIAELGDQDDPPPEETRRLTGREIEVIGLVVDGLSNREIAERLNLGEQTVKNHVTRVMRKLGVRNRVELAIYAVRERLA